MKIMIIIVAIAAFFSGHSSAQNSHSDVVCRNNEIIIGNVFVYRAQGIPVGSAVSMFESQRDINLKIFMMQVTRGIYANPDDGRKYIQSGQFRAACIKIHRGY